MEIMKNLALKGEVSSLDRKFIILSPAKRVLGSIPPPNIANL
jgi:hypothetical protein